MKRFQRTIDCSFTPAQVSLLDHLRNGYEEVIWNREFEASPPRLAVWGAGKSPRRVSIATVRALARRGILQERDSTPDQQVWVLDAAWKPLW